MIFHDVKQGSPEWLALRAGIPTASQFDMIMTRQMKPSKSATRYMHTLLAERIMGHPVVEAMTTWMDRGTQMEAEAVAYYEGQRDLDTEKIGFITNDDGTIGASPDRLVGDVGLLEIKVPKEHTHVGYLLNDSSVEDYYQQIQGQLWVSGRQWADIMSYHPEMPAALIRVERDEDFIEALSAAVGEFSRILEVYAVRLRDMGWISVRAAPCENLVNHPDNISVDDLVDELMKN